jgi:hypothetical protein
MCSDTHWLTTTELEVRYNIPPHISYQYGSVLERDGIARRTGSSKVRGAWLFKAEAIGLLQQAKQQRKVGRPLMFPDEVQERKMRQVWRNGHNGHRRHTIIAVQEALGVCDRVAKRWLKEAGLWRK